MKNIHSCWFQKPIYKILRLIVLFLLGGMGILFLFWNPAWTFMALVLVLWTAFLTAAAFHNRSGVFVKTLCHGSSAVNQVAITFDDGPAEATREILQILEKHKARASFFITGVHAEKHKEIVTLIQQAGHTIGNHTLSHSPCFPLAGIIRVRKELGSTQEIIQQITGSNPRFFRAPYGITNPLIARALENMQLTTIGWSVRSLDTVIKDPKEVLKRITSRICPGSIILVHDTTPQIGMILEQLLLYCSQAKLQPVTLEEMFNHI